MKACPENLLSMPGDALARNSIGDLRAFVQLSCEEYRANCHPNWKAKEVPEFLTLLPVAFRNEVTICVSL